MRTILLSVLSLLFLLMFSNGCTHMTMLRTRELRAVQSRVDTLHSELMTLQNKLMEEQKTQSEILRLLRADQQVRFTDLDRKITIIEGNLSENQNKLLKIDEKTEQFQKRLEAKFTGDSLSSSSRSAEIDKLFQIAMSDFNAARYDIAINGFNELINQFAGTPTAIEAQYWVAECYNAKKEYPEAEKAYLENIKKYPDGNRLCVSLYKLGLVYEKLDKAKSKEMVWKSLVERCPSSNEAQVVKAQK